MAIKQYESQFGVLPEVSTTETGSALSGSHSGGGTDLKITENSDAYTIFISTLTNVSTGIGVGNVRGIRFLEPVDPSNPNNYTDSWGKQFRIKLDTTYDGAMNGDGMPNIGSNTTLYTNVGICSSGADETIGNDDDVMSYQD
jgi:hypothetical protein